MGGFVKCFMIFSRGRSKKICREIKAIAETVQSKLIDKGFIVQRYNAYTTNSIYLKLDYGICNSIRISDHRGKEYLHYRYNLSKQATRMYVDRKGKYPRYFYPLTKYDKMLSDIEKRRSEKIAKLGMGGYKEEMFEYKRNNENNKGFWQTAVLVNRSAEIEVEREK